MQLQCCACVLVIALLLLTMSASAARGIHVYCFLLPGLLTATLLEHIQQRNHVEMKLV